MIQDVRSVASYKALQRAEIGLELRIGVDSIGRSVGLRSSIDIFYLTDRKDRYLTVGTN